MTYQTRQKSKNDNAFNYIIDAKNRDSILNETTTATYFTANRLWLYYRIRPLRNMALQSNLCFKVRPICYRHVTNQTMPIHPPHPSLEVTGGARDAFLPVLRSLGDRPYTPFPVIGWNRHVETIFAAFFRSLPAVRLKRECLRTKDDGSVALDWASGDHQRLPPDSPILILLVSSPLLCFN